MGRKLYQFSCQFIFGFSMVIFTLFTIYLIFMGSFYWEGGNTAYMETGTPLRGLEMLGAVILLCLLFLLIIKGLRGLSRKKLLVLTTVCGIVIIFLQFAFVAAAQAGIRYDALKVFDEALALFSQRGIQETDLSGYFARYSNNYAMTIMTHWIIKIFRAVGIVHEDFSNAVLVMQFVNILFVDAAFAGAWALVKKYAGIRPGAVFVIYMGLNPLSYVWLPFYYTNTCSMAFAVWGAYLVLDAFERAASRTLANGKWTRKKAVCQCIFAGGLFAIGFEIRATTAIALIAALVTIFCFFRSLPGHGAESEQKGLKLQTGKPICCAGICLLALFLAMGVTKMIYSKVEDHYLAFDETDTEFPMAHWIAMGLSDTGAFSPADEAYTMGFATREEKKEADIALIKERASGLGPVGVVKLYLKKLAVTFADGAGGYHSELNISRKYGWLWQVVYGVHRDPLLAVTQVFYLLSLVSGAGAAVLLWKKKLPGKLFFLPLFLLGSYLFQMIWEAGTIYSIGTMYVNGCMTAVFLPKVSSAVSAAGNGAAPKEKTGKKLLFAGVLGIGVVGLCLMIRGFFSTKYVEVSMSVDQFLFQANEYTALTEGMEISQTFTTDKDFSTIALQVHNIEGEFNDSVYSVCLYDGEGKLLKEQELQGSLVKDYTFYPLSFENAEGVNDYELRIRKISGIHDLIFLYYDTGHYDVYPGGRLTGLTEGEMADLIFEVYWREEE